MDIRCSGRQLINIYPADISNRKPNFSNFVEPCYQINETSGIQNCAQIDRKLFFAFFALHNWNFGEILIMFAKENFSQMKNNDTCYSEVKVKEYFHKLFRVLIVFFLKIVVFWISARLNSEGTLSPRRSIK